MISGGRIRGVGVRPRQKLMIPAAAGARARDPPTRRCGFPRFHRGEGGKEVKEGWQGWTGWLVCTMLKRKISLTRFTFSDRGAPCAVAAITTITMMNNENH